MDINGASTKTTAVTMSQEISLSIEETNILRVKAGLKPIPVPVNDQQEKKKDEDGVISLSIEETNKLRARIGLPLIPTESTILDSDVKNFEKHQQEISNKQKNDELQQRINDAKFKANKRKLVSNETLIDRSKELDTDDWLLKLTNNEDDESKAKKKQKTNKNRKDDEVLAVIGHSAKELRSIGDNEILTLKDTDLFDEDDEDILTSETLSRQAKLKRDLAERKEAESIKFNGRHYRNNDDEGDGEDNDLDNSALIGNDRVIINKNTVNLPQVQPSKAESDKSNIAKFNNLFDEIDDIEDKEPKPVIKMKKIKKRKPAKVSKQRKLDDEVSVQLISMEDESGDEDSDISQSLANFRTKKLNLQANFTPEKLAEEIAANRRWEFERKLEKESLTKNIYDDTVGFLNNLENNILSDDEKPREDIQDDPHSNGVSKSGDTDTFVEKSTTPKFSGGLADTLKFLKSKNIIESPSNNSQVKSQELERQEVAKKSELLKMKISIEERILREELTKNKEYILMPKSEKASYFEKLLDSRLKEKGIVIKDDDLKVYNPKVQITYKDRMGNVLDRKKAWKEFSHQYHGTGLDKNKKK